MKNFWSDAGEWIKNLGKWGMKNWQTLVIIVVLIVIGFIIYIGVYLYQAFKGTPSPKPIGSELKEWSLPPTEAPTPAPTEAPTEAPTPAPTYPPVKNFIAFVGSDNQSIIKYDNDTEDIGMSNSLKWIFDVGSIILNYSLSTDDKHIIVGCMDNTAQYIDISEFGGLLVSTMVGHTGPVSSTAISQDGTKSLTGSDDGTVKYWDLVNEVLLATINIGNPIIGLDFVGTGDKNAIIITGDAYLYNLETTEIIEPSTSTPWTTEILKPSLIQTYLITDTYGSAKYVKTILPGEEFAIATESHVVTYNINSLDVVGSTVNRFDEGSFKFSGKVLGFAVNNMRQAVIYYENGSVNMINLNIDEFGKLIDIRSFSSNLSPEMSNKDREGIDFSKDGSLLTAGGIIWDTITTNQLKYTCPGCASDCSCGSALWRFPRFFNL